MKQEGISIVEKKVNKFLPENRERIESEYRKRKEKYEKLLEQAYATRQDAEISAHLGEVLWSNGKRDRAQKVWREGLKADDSNATLLETLKRLNVKP